MSDAREGMIWRAEYAEETLRNAGHTSTADVIRDLLAALAPVGQPAAAPSHGGRLMTLRECMDAEDGGAVPDAGQPSNREHMALLAAIDKLRGAPMNYPLFRSVLNAIDDLINSLHTSPPVPAPAPAPVDAGVLLLEARKELMREHEPLHCAIPLCRMCALIAALAQSGKDAVEQALVAPLAVEGGKAE